MDRARDHLLIARAVAGAAFVIGAATAFEASADTESRGGVDLQFTYTADYVFPVADTGGDGAFLDNLDISATIDMEKIAGWRATTLYFDLLNNSGAAPNDDIGTLQGVDNIEVERHRARLYEFWIETQLGPTNVRAGLYDLNSEFYANDSASLLIAPAFGIGSELAATGPNGPSIFPSTALAARFQWTLSESSRLQFAALNATAGVLGDPGGVDTSFDDGALLVAEWSWLGATHVNVGGWLYTESQDDIRRVDGAGDPLKQRAFGGYLTLERVLWSDGVEASGFLRAGFADGDTTPFDGGWQAGILVNHVFSSRPESMFSIGVNQAFVTDAFRLNQVDVGVDAESYEGGIEITYADTFGPLTIQPDLQFIRNPGVDAARNDAVVGTLRFTASF